MSLLSYDFTYRPFGKAKSFGELRDAFSRLKIG